MFVTVEVFNICSTLWVYGSLSHEFVHLEWSRNCVNFFISIVQCVASVFSIWFLKATSSEFDFV